MNQMIRSELDKEARILSYDTILLENIEELYTTKSIKRRGTYRNLVNRYYHQIRYGCQNAMCETPTCLSSQKRKTKGPFRRLTVLSARALASFLASQDDPEQKLCPYPAVSLHALILPRLKKFSEDEVIHTDELSTPLVGQSNMGPIQSIKEAKEKQQEQKGEQVRRHEPALRNENTFDTNKIELNSNEPNLSKDPKSLAQNLYDTKSWKMLQNLSFDNSVFSWVPSDDNIDLDSKGVWMDGAEEDNLNLKSATEMSVEELMGSETTSKALQQSRSSSSDRFLALSRFTPANVNALWRLTNATRWSSNREIALIKSLGLTIPYSKVSLLRGVSPNSSDIFTSSSFALQSIVYVLSTSKALLQSFKQHGLRQMEGENVHCNTSIHYSDMIIAFRQLGDIESHPRRVFPSLWVSLGDAFAINRHNRFSAYPNLLPIKTSDSFSTSLGSSGSSIHNDDAEMIADGDVAHIIKVVLAALVASVPRVNNFVWEDVVHLRSSGRITPYDPAHGVYSTESLQAVMDSYEDDLAINLMTRLLRVFASRRCYLQVLETRENTQAEGSTSGGQRSAFIKTIVSFMYDDGRTLPLFPVPITFEEAGVGAAANSKEDGTQSYRRQTFSAIVLEWVRTVLLKEWNGKPEILRWSTVSSGLNLMGYLYRNREELHLMDRDFYTPFLSARLDSAEMPVNWLNSPLRTEKVHLLSYPFLFQPSTLVMYFRAINYASMFKAFETSYTMTRMLYQMSQVSDRNQERLFSSLRTAMTNNLVLEIRRNNILIDALNQLWRREKRELLRPLKVRMGMDEGEEGVDLGGVQQEFFRIAIGEALNSDYGLFTTNLANRMSWFQPCSLEPLYKFELLGLLVSLAVYNGLTLPLTFPIALYRKLLDLPVDTLNHIKDGWPELTKGLTELLKWPGDDVEDVFVRSYVFSVEALGVTLHVDMEHVGREGAWAPIATNRGKERIISFDLQQDQKALDIYPNQSVVSSEPSDKGNDGWIPGPDPNAQPINTKTTSHQGLGKSSSFRRSHWGSSSNEPNMVNNSNRERYVNDYVYWLTDKSVRPQYEAFARGFFKCIDRKTISMFSPEALRTIVEGIQEINVEQLEQVAKYDGYSVEHRVVRNFWSVVHSFTQDQVRRLLEFVTASDRIPVNGIRSIAFVIQKNGTGDERLPTSTTCFGRLLLPEYSTKERLEERLYLAMENCHGFGNG